MTKLSLSDILTSPVTTVPPNCKVDQALSLMREQKISAIIITKDAFPVGIFTERDALKAVGQGYDTSVSAIEEVMSQPVLSVPIHMEYREAYYLIAEHGVRHLVVTDAEGKLAGIVSEGDFMKKIGMEFLLHIKEVGALMTKEVQTLPPDAKLKEALSLMELRRLSCIVIVENDIPVGMLTERDIVRIKTEDNNILEMPLSELMTYPVTTVEKELSLPDAMQIMEKGNFRRVVVVDKMGHTLGLLTRHDIVKQLYNSHVELLEETLKSNETQLKIVTQELEKERGLHALKSRLIESQRLAHIGSWEHNHVTDELCCSDETYRIFEINPSEFTLSIEKIFDLIHPDEREKVAQAYRDSIKSKTPYNIVFRICFDDGCIKHLHERSVTEYDKEGKPLHSVGTVQDITERYEKDEEIERYHAMLMALVESSTDTIFIKNNEGKYIVGNEALANLLGKPIDEIIGTDDFTLFPAQNAEQYRADDQRIIQNNKVETYEEIVLSGERTFTYLTTKGPLVINGYVEGIFGIAKDISTLKETEKALKESKGLLRLFIEHVPAALAMFDEDMRYLAVSQRWKDDYKLGDKDIIGKSHYAVFPDITEEWKDVHRRALRGEVIKHDNDRFERSDGSVQWLKWEVHPWYIAEDKVGGLIVATEDITERKIREKHYQVLFDRTGTSMGVVEEDGTLSLVNETFADLAGSTTEALTGSLFLDLVDTSERERMQAYHLQRIRGEKSPEKYEFKFVSQKGRQGTGMVYAVLLAETHQTIVSIIDITGQKKAQKELMQKTWFLESLDSISKTLTEKYDSADLLQALSKLILEIFKVDRAWFVYPCNPEATAYSVIAESTVGMYPGAFEKHTEIPSDAYDQELFKRALEEDTPSITQSDDFGELPITIEKFEIQSQMSMAMKPQLGDAWLMGLHQCSHKRKWDEIEIRLYKAIAERLGLALSGTLLLKQVQENEQILLEAERTAKLGHWELDIRTWKAYWSDEIHRITGTDPSMAVGPEFLSTIVNNEDWSVLENSLIVAAKKGTTHEMEYRINRPDGEERWVYCKAERQNDKENNPLKLVGILQDITERKKEEQVLRLSAAVFENTSEGIMITDADANIISVNPAFTNITGYSEAEVIGRNPRLLHSNRQDRTFYDQMWHTLEATGGWQGEIWNRKKNGEIYPEWLSLGIIRDEKNNVNNYIGLFADITHVKKSEEEYRFLATHDPLTKLPNRILLNEQLEYALKRMQRHEDSIAVLYLDLDRFKEINDSLGHPAGDRLLEIIAERFSGVLREEDFVARVSGDEFVIILEEIKTPSDAGHLAEKILNVIKQPMIIDNHEVTMTASIGIAMSPIDGSNNVLLLKNADSALYRAKEDGRNTYSFYSEELAVKNFELMYLHNALYNALEKEEFVVYYQPQINMQTGEVVGTEALVRWNSPEMGLVSPGRFIPVAEETGLIIPLGEWVLRQACLQMKKWKQAGFSMRHVAVNLSGRQLVQEKIVQIIQNVIEDTGISSQCLELEITESVVMQDEGNIAKLNALKALGIRLSIDDFGTGYSSLARLRNMPIDKLKIDQSFVTGIPDEEENVKITDVIIQLSESLNMHVIAEGVETKIQGDYLMKRGCMYAQGYFYSRPLPPEELELWLKAQNNTFKPN